MAFPHQSLPGIAERAFAINRPRKAGFTEPSRFEGQSEMRELAFCLGWAEGMFRKSANVPTC
jgi:hypothetical protein